MYWAVQVGLQAPLFVGIPIEVRRWVAPGKRRVGALEGHIFFNWDSSPSGPSDSSNTTNTAEHRIRPCAPPLFPPVTVYGSDFRHGSSQALDPCSSGSPRCGRLRRRGRCKSTLRGARDPAELSCRPLLCSVPRWDHVPASPTILTFRVSCSQRMRRPLLMPLLMFPT